MLAFNLRQATESGIFSALTFAILWGAGVLVRAVAIRILNWPGLNPLPPTGSLLLSGIEMRQGVTMTLLIGLLEFVSGGSIRLASVLGVLGFAAAVLVAYKATESLKSATPS